MPSTKPTRKRTAEHLHKSKNPKRFKKQKNYHSSSESEDEDEGDESLAFNDYTKTTSATTSTRTPDVRKAGEVQESEDADSTDEEDDDVENLDVLDSEDDEPALDDESIIEDHDSLMSDASDSNASSQEGSKKRKRNDPSAFANSMSKILSSKLSVSKRADPVLARSTMASTAQKEMADTRLEAQAKQKLRAEKKAALERGRVKDVLGLDTEGVSTAEIQERERRLKKTAQRGVVKLFNAVRAAQVQADVATEQARKEGVVGMAQREQRINEMSKQGFLDLIAKGGK